MSSDNIIALGRSEGSSLQAQDAEAQLQSALSTLDSMREALVDGRIKAFIAVGVSRNHDTFAWSGKRDSFTTLEAQGAWASLYGMLPEVL